ncbi:recombinase family protein [Agrococcus sp. DT81.2]|uniref:recombinase family protein n=1 Tax=Agrococcus sp. DT81.2 TaxID=3393414 RepID=UPI003CE4AEA5
MSMIRQRAAIYCRISLDRTGEAAGVGRQEAECRELAGHLGLDVGQVYIDNDISATSGKERPAFEQMLADRPAAVVTWAQDRLLRLSADLEKVIALNIPVHMVTQGSLDLATPAGRAVARTVAAWSTFETEQKGLRQRAANVQRAKQGKPAPSVGYGYRRDGDRLAIVDAEAAVVREVARRVLDGEPLRAIAADLNARGVQSPRRTAGAGVWNGTTLRQMIRRESLAGLRRYNGQIVGAGLWEPIITPDDHSRIVAVLNDPTRAKHYAGRAPKHLLAGIAKCGKCGARMKRAPGRMTTTKSGTKRQPAAYSCPACFGVRRKQEDVDALVSTVLVRRLEQPDALDLFRRDDNGAGAAAREAIAAIDARLSNAADAYSAGALELDQLTRITAQLRADRAEHEALVARALPTALPADLAGPSAAERWTTLSIDAQRLILTTLLRVTILPAGPGRDFDPATVRIDWNR